MCESDHRILAIGAHPDDLEIGCGGALAKMHQAGYQIMGLILSHGERGGEIPVRISQAFQSGSFLGLDEIRILNFPDTILDRYERKIFDSIENCIQAFKPTIILTHSENDLHQDHVVVHRATMRAARNIHTILCYESPLVTAKFIPTFFISVQEFVSVKVKSILAHQDQSHKFYTSPEQVCGRMLFRGGQAKVQYAEGFEVVRILSSDIGGI